MPQPRLTASCMLVGDGDYRPTVVSEDGAEVVEVIELPGSYVNASDAKAFAERAIDRIEKLLKRVES